MHDKILLPQKQKSKWIEAPKVARGWGARLLFLVASIKDDAQREKICRAPVVNFFA